MRTQRYEVQGLEVPVEVWGTSDETLVFLPGLGVHPKYYRPAFRALAPELRVVVPDLSFKTHRRLPREPAPYLELIGRLTLELAPDAVWAGHSFGALLALMSDRPAVACAPSVPARVGPHRMFVRAAHQQIRELAGLEGWTGFTYAPQIMLDYVRTALTRPRSLFPALGSLNTASTAYPPATPSAIVYLSRRDELYRAAEYDAYFEDVRAHGPHDSASDRPARIEMITVEDCHDWPITRPERLAGRLAESAARVRGV